ncbi:Dipeptidyl aminopeptidase/acylaminoacyl peptidase [Brevundimonas sp. G8]|nr:Dipeptidyl aminopeptidase/acylaminoacyl peptidase [Brevundimonas sp. G8]
MGEFMLKSVLSGLVLTVLSVVALGGGMVSGAQAQVQGAPPSLDIYAASPTVELMALSPSGDLIARIVVTGEQRAIAVTHMNRAEHVFAASIGEAKVRDLRWIGEGKVLIISSQTRAIHLLGVPRSELYFGMILDLETQKLTRVLDRTQDVLPVLYGGASVRETDQGPTLFVRGFNVETGQSDLHRVDLSSGRGRSVVPMDRETDDYVLDGEGVVIATARYVERSGRWTMMLPNGRRFREAWTTDAPVDTPTFLGMGRTPRTVVISADRPDLAAADPESETQANLFEVNVDTGEWTKLPFAHHPDALWHHPRTRLLIGGSRVEEDGVRYEFIDPTSASRWRSIERAFEGKAPQLVSWSADQKRILVFSDIGESGLYQLVDFDRRTADALAFTYPDIPPEQVGAVRHVTYDAADGLKIPGYLTLPPGVETPEKLPLIVLAHGGPASRDVMGFDWWAQALASRGYAVLQPNFRGSEGYTRAFLEAGYGEWGRKMQTDLSDGVRWLTEQGIVDPDRVCIVGASYGGYAAMAGLTLDRGVYRCAVAVAGVSDLRRMVNWEARQERSRNNQTVRYWNRFMGAARLNDRALDALSPAYLADTVDKPLLLIHGRDDTVVAIEQSRVMAEAMRRAGKPVELIELEGEDHWLSRADTRQQMLRETVRFLEANNPAR